MSEFTHLSLFSGIGGLDLAAEWAGFRTVGQCEWADYPHAVLQKHWPHVPKWRDIRSLTKEGFRERTGLDTVTVLSGGFPCQPFSTAGKRRGKEDDRYLWPEMCRVISEIRPAWVFGENVAGLVSMELDAVLSDLEGIGYACQAFIIPACAVDAPHRRDRCAILCFDPHRKYEKTVSQVCGGENSHSGGICADVAYANGPGLQGDELGGAFDPGGKAESLGSAAQCGEDVAHAYGEVPSDSVRAWGREPGFGNFNRWPAEPDVGRVAHGVPARVDRLRCLGNAVVPQWARVIFRAIADIERRFT